MEADILSRALLLVSTATESILSLFILYLPPTSYLLHVSTDQLIANRRKDAVPKPAPKKISKAVSNTDRSIANSRAKRGAAMDKKRGMRQESKPSAMQVDNEVSKQVRKTATSKAKKQAVAKGSVKVVMAKATPRRERQEAARASTATARKAKTGGPKKVEGGAASLSRPPSKKVVTAAVNAMEEKGFSIPSGMQMVISFAPAPGAPAVVAKGLPQKQNPRNAQQPKAKNAQQPKAKNSTGAQNNAGAQNNTGAQNTTGGNRRRGGRNRGNNNMTN
jgi:hypothetical protein